MNIIQRGLTAVLLMVSLGFSSLVVAQRININTADAQSLADNLKGVGLIRAEAIILWRTEHGQFIDLVGLEDVKGIGPKTIAKNKQNIQF
jgi:competence protein ComEA